VMCRRATRPIVTFPGRGSAENPGFFMGFVHYLGMFNNIEQEEIMNNNGLVVKPPMALTGAFYLTFPAILILYRAEIC
jgi:hypothetical protein